MWKEILAALPPDVVVTLVALVFTGLNVLLGLALNEVRKHFKSAAANSVIDRVERAARTVTGAIEQRIVKPLKENNGGKLTQEDIVQVQELAMIALKDELGKAGLAAVNAITQDTARVLSDKLEAAVHEQRRGATAVPVTTVNNSGPSA